MQIGKNLFNLVAIPENRLGSKYCKYFLYMMYTEFSFLNSF